MAEFKEIVPGFSVAAQMSVEDVAEAAKAGFRVIVNNRPDGEVPDQPTSAEIEAAARAHGLRYVAIPVSGGPTEAALAAETQALAEADGPVVAYCRSGTRSTTIWGLVQAKTGARAPDEIIGLAAKAGYDLSRAAPLLRALSDGQRGKG